jgi:hypothetical protein
MFTIIFVTGRSEKYRAETIAWLKKHSEALAFELLMRPTNDTRKDYIVKAELYNKHIKGKHEVMFALDDRTRVVD